MKTNSAYFYRKEISNARNKNITTIMLEYGTTVTQPKEIMKCQKNYYDKLYTQQTNINKLIQEEAKDHFLAQNNTTKVKQEDRDLLDRPIERQTEYL
jgi:hypothetical protein